MSDTTVLALIAAIAPTLAALAAFIQNLRNHAKNEVVAKLADAKADTNQHVTEEIRDFVGETASKVARDLAAANKQISELHALLAESQANMQNDLNTANQRIAGLQQMVRKAVEKPPEKPK